MALEKLSGSMPIVNIAGRRQQGIFVRVRGCNFGFFVTGPESLQQQCCEQIWSNRT
jgi:hypothetical protein